MPLRLADAFQTPEDPPSVSDADFLLTCTCGLDQRLDTALVDELPGVTMYDCKRCENTLVAILTDDVAVQLRLTSGAVGRQLSSGTWRGGYVFGSRVDVGLRPPGAEDEVLQIFATPLFFDALLNI